MTDILRKAFTPFDFKLSETGDVTVAFSRFNVIDSDNDVTFPGAMPVGKSVPMSAFGHTSWDGALPTGVGLRLSRPAAVRPRGLQRAGDPSTSQARRR